MFRLCLITLVSTALLPVLARGEQRSPVVSAKDAPVKMVKRADGVWFADFGKAAFGNIEITSPDAAPGTKLTVHLGEALSSAETIHRKPGGTVRYQKFEVTLRPRVAVSPLIKWTPPGWLKDGFLDAPKGVPDVMPFRYAEIVGAPASFDASQLRRVTWSVPFDETASSFESSSPELDSVWDLCKHSIKATTFLGLYIDGDRERKPYEADVLINQLSHYCVDSRYDTARLSHEYLLESPTWPTEWRLQSVLIAWNDYLWSGEDASLRRYYSTLKQRVMADRRTPDGLFRGFKDGEIRDIIDWPAGERDGYDMDTEIKTVVTAFHYRALVLMEKIAAHLGKTSDAKEFGTMAQATFAAFNGKLWDETRGCYADGLDKSGKQSSHASAHANFFPLALGLVPQDRAGRVAAFLKPRGMACSVYGSQFLLEALYQAGEGEAAHALLVSNSLRSWRNMIEKVGSTITLEAWDPSLKPNLDWNHAWGAAPANLIPRGLMGIEPLEPGFKRFRVRPQTAGLDHAKLKLPTPKGPVLLGIRGRDTATWSADLTVPAGTAAEFHLPYAGTATLEDGGNSVPARVLREEGGRQVIGLVPGTWKVRIKAATSGK